MIDLKKKLRELSRWVSTNIPQYRQKIGILICVMAFMVIDAIPYLPSGLQTAFNSIVGAALGSLLISLLWESKEKQLFIDELQLEFFDRLDTIIDESSVQHLVRVEGLKGFAWNMRDNVRWTDLIAKADEIEAFWWSGRSWMKSNSEALKDFAARGGTFRVVLPDVDNQEVVKQMQMEHSLEESDIKAIHNEALRLIESFSFKKKYIYLSPVTNRYMYLRVGDVVFAQPYPLPPEHVFTGAPVLMMNRNLKAGKYYSDDFKSFIESTKPEELDQQILASQ